MVLLTPALFDCAPTSPKGIVRPVRGQSAAVSLGARLAYSAPIRAAQSARAERHSAAA